MQALTMNSKCFSKDAGHSNQFTQSCWNVVHEVLLHSTSLKLETRNVHGVLTALSGASHTWWHSGWLLVVTVLCRNKKHLINKINTVIPAFVPGRSENVTTSSQSRVPMRAVISTHIVTAGPPSLPEYGSCSNIIVTATRGINQYS